MEDQAMDPKDSGAQDPYRALLFKLTGVGIQRPRLRSAVNTWRKTQRIAIEHEVKRVVTRDGTHRSQLAKLRDAIARKMFERLPAESQKYWGDRAKEEHEAALKRWKDDTTGKPSKDPVARQQCIQSLFRFTQPILDLINEATGWPVTLMTGGPEPAHGGRLNIISLHAGTTSGDVQMNFGQAERLRYKEFFVPIYRSFLQKCFSPEECRQWVLPEGEKFDPLESLNLDSAGANFDTYNEDSATSSATTGTSHCPTLPGIPSHSEPRLPSPSRDSSPPHRSEPLVPTPVPSPNRSLSLSPAPLQSSMHSPTYAPPPARLPSPEPCPTATAIGKRKNANGDEDISRTSKKPKSARNAEEDAIEERGSTDEYDMLSDGNECDAQTSHAEPNNSPPLPPISSKLRPTRASMTAYQPAKSPRAKKGAASRATAIRSLSPPSTRVAASEPAWFTKVSGMLRSIDGGTYWKRLLDVWSAFEAQEKYLDGKLLPKNERPEAISEWMKRHRSQTWRPPPMKSFGKGFKVWWVSLQSEWRVTEGRIANDYDGDFSPLKKSGPNGFLLILVGLFYWRLNIKLEEEKE